MALDRDSDHMLRLKSAPDETAWRAVWALGQMGPAVVETKTGIVEEMARREHATFKVAEEALARMTDRVAK